MVSVVASPSGTLVTVLRALSFEIKHQVTIRRSAKREGISATRGGQNQCGGNTKSEPLFSLTTNDEKTRKQKKKIEKPKNRYRRGFIVFAEALLIFTL